MAQDTERPQATVALWSNEKGGKKSPQFTGVVTLPDGTELRIGLWKPRYKNANSPAYLGKLELPEKCPFVTQAAKGFAQELAVKWPDFESSEDLISWLRAQGRMSKEIDHYVVKWLDEHEEEDYDDYEDFEDFDDEDEDGVDRDEE